MISVLIACESSGALRSRFRARGFNATSVDLLPADDGETKHHKVDDVTNWLGHPWDLVIAHPPCTYMANSGVRWLYNEDGSRNEDRFAKLTEAVEFFNLFLQLSHVPFVAIENPVMSRKHTGIRKPDFSVHPWMFGDNEMKRTCWWTKGLPPLKPTSDLDGSTARQSVWRCPPSEDRWKIRSKTFPGMADAIVDQWGSYVEEKMYA